MSVTVENAAASLRAGRFEQARTLLARHLQRAPTDPRACALMSTALVHLGQYDAAVHYGLKALAAAPDDPGQLTNVANCLLVAGRASEAVDHAQRAVGAAPSHRGAAVVLTHALKTANRWIEGAKVGAEALARFPGDTEIALGLAGCLAHSGYAERAESVLAETERHAPSDLRVLVMLATIQNYIPGRSDAAILTAHQKAARAIAAGITPMAPATARTTGPLRLALLSPDLRAHSVAWFVRPILEHLDHARFRVMCFSTAAAEDSVTDSLRPLAEWRHVHALTDAQLADRIRAEHVDVLIDLAGLTAEHRLGVLSRKPAPIQMTYLGYPGTTALAAVGFRIVDSITDPPGSESSMTERPLRLDPCFMCYTPSAEPEESSRILSSTNDPIVFGSFNNLQKLNDEHLRLWSRLFARIPESRLLVKAKGTGDHLLREDLLARLAAAGIARARERVEIVPYAATHTAHRAAYRSVDILLDTFPYNGATTTCESLWMGVPVVTLSGATHASRVGRSLLTAAGVGEWCANTEDEFLRIAEGLAERARLADERRTLRDRLLRSDLCDDPKFARRFADAITGVMEESRP